MTHLGLKGTGFGQYMKSRGASPRPATVVCVRRGGLVRRDNSAGQYPFATSQASVNSMDGFFRACIWA
jgi:hypothetical protein